MITKFFKTPYAGDLLIAIILLAICASSLFIKTPVKNSVTLSVDVFVDGKLVTALSLNSDAEFSPDGGHTVIAVENGVAFIKSSDCPDGTCMKMQGISEKSASQGPVCVPNRVSLTSSKVENSSSKDHFTDAVAG